MLFELGQSHHRGSVFIWAGVWPYGTKQFEVCTQTDSQTCPGKSIAREHLRYTACNNVHGKTNLNTNTYRKWCERESCSRLTSCAYRTNTADTHMQGSDVLVAVGNFTCPNAISISVGQWT